MTVALHLHSFLRQPMRFLFLENLIITNAKVSINVSQFLLLLSLFKSIIYAILLLLFQPINYEMVILKYKWSLDILKNKKMRRKGN